MSDFPKNFDFAAAEERWYAAWREAGCFTGRVNDGKPSFSIVIPPPNVTGVLTMGHVLNNTIQDILVRRARQTGYSVLWLPGTDHAGIATQSRVERELRKNGQTRHDLGREKFLQKAVEWRDTHGGIILQQLQRLGCSCDWDRTVHTLDEDYSKAVLEAFVRLYQRGYIYRGKRMVNWCPVSLTALSDEEVIMKPQKGKLYHVRYPVVGSEGEFVEIATTRPETIMGDVAVAVHPADSRYQHLLGKHVWRPFPRQQIPVIADEYIDREFGTGVLKVTPAHDKADYEIGLRHQLPVLEVFTPEGKLNELAGEPFAGMDRFEAREKAAGVLAEMGLLVKVEDYENNVGFSERADVPIEPRLSEQWFLRYPKVTEAASAVRDGLIRFHPPRWEKTYLHWLDKIQDWCISRQLWWGHRIPVWYRKGMNRADPESWHVSLNGPDDPENWQQDEDVLDTWASSWLWPIATLGWPDEAAMQERGLSYFYPTSVLVTGPDIIFFWVARMIMAGLEFYGEEKQQLSAEELAARIPFRDVYFTGIIRDLEGRKMSKSLGNSPDPLDLIAQLGADGLRFGIMSIAPQGQDIRFSEERVTIGRNFCTKLWNACRFRQLSGAVSRTASLEDVVRRIDPEELDLQDHAIIGKLLDLIDQTDRAYAEFSFSGITQLIYSFFWSDFCDWYVEVSKAKVQNPKTRETSLAVQDLVIRQLLLLLHPFCPFITEELWSRCGFAAQGDFIGDVRPSAVSDILDLLDRHEVALDRAAVGMVDEMRETVTAIRSVKAEYQLSNRKDVTFYLVPQGERWTEIGDDASEVMQNQAGVEDIVVVREIPEGAPSVITPFGSFFLDLATAIDVEAEQKRLGAEMAKLDKLISGIQAKLNNPQFVERAKPEVVEGARGQLADNVRKRDELARLLGSIKG